MRFDSEGRRELVYHRIYYVRRSEAVEDWDSVSVSFTPWHQSKPTLRARVITSDSKQHWLDEKTLVDSPAMEYEKDIYSDRRVLSAPLPAVEAGAVVEWEYRLKDTAQFYASGTIHSWKIGEWNPVEKVSLELSAPKGLDLKVVGRMLPPGAFERSESGGEVRWRLEMSPGPKVLAALPLIPSNEVAQPFVGISTGKTWQSVAAAYSKIVDERIAGAKLAELGLTLTEKSSREDAIETLLRRIHKQVRYIGIELGDGAIHPRTPSETMTRHYGDCKDKAALLVAALRGAGIPAYVALLDAGGGQDVDKELPGMGSFNHAIAYVPGPKPLWIDVTAENARLGTLPLGDQGRLALIASPETTELVKTPVAAMEENYDLSLREITMTDGGPSKLVETIEARGGMESALRAVYAGEVSKEMRDSLKSYAKGTLLSEEQTILSQPAKHDFSQPLVIRWETPNTKRFIVERSIGVGFILPSPLLENLPYWFKSKPEASEGRKDPEELEWEKRNAERTLPFEVNHPFISEMKYRVTPPPYFKPKSLPRSGVEVMGPARLEKKFSLDPKGVVEVILRFEMPKATLTVEEAQALRDKAIEFTKNGAIRLDFVHRAEEAMALGKPKEALDDLRAAVKQEPNLPVHRSRLARAYLQAGLGARARAEAKKATELDPKSANAFRDLAFVLQHDLVGRHFRSGWDQAGAVAALQRSLELETLPATRADLAITYEHDINGSRYSRTARLDEALAEYKKLGESLKVTGVEQNYSLCLMMLRRWEEMEAAAEKLSNTQFAKLLHYVARAGIDGAGPTILSIQGDFPDTNSRTQVLTAVGATMMQTRDYAVALEFMKAAERLSPNAQLKNRIEMLGKTKRIEDLVMDPKDPAAPVKKFMQALFSPQFTFAAVRPYFYDLGDFDRELREAKERGEDPEAELATQMRAVTHQLQAQGMTPDSVEDMMSSVYEFTSSGDDEVGYRLDGKVGGKSDFGKFYVLKKDGEFRLGASSNDLNSFRPLVRALLKADRLKAAQTWMDWLVEDLPVKDAADELMLPPVRYLWSGVNSEARGKEAIEVALASLKGDKSHQNKEEIAILRQALLKAKLPRDRHHLLLALAQQQELAKDWKGLLDTSRKLALAAPKSGAAFELLIHGMIENGLLAEAQAAAEARLKTTAKALKTNVELEDEKALTALAEIAMAKKNWKEAVSVYDRLAKQRNFNEEVKAKALWVRNLAGINEKPPFELAEEGVGAVAQTKDVAGTLPLAMFFALQGKPAEARQRIVRYLEVSGADIRKPEVAAVLARLAESLDEREQAEEFWQSITAPKALRGSFGDGIALRIKESR